jgi:hypothetical protein
MSENVNEKNTDLSHYLTNQDLFHIELVNRQNLVIVQFQKSKNREQLFNDILKDFKISNDL